MDKATHAHGPVRVCNHCGTKQEYQLVEEVPDELIFKAHELGVPVRTKDKKGLLDLEFPLVNFSVIVFVAHDGPCELPCIGAHKHVAAKFEEHSGSLCKEKGCRDKIKNKQLNSLQGYHDGSSCPCNTPLPEEPQGEV